MRVCVIGHGRMGQNHARVLRQLGHAVVTVDPRPETKADLDGIWLPEDCGAAVIAVPIDRLAQQAGRAIHAGMDVLVEKPGAIDLAQLEQLHELAEQRGRRIAIGYVERFNPAVAVLQNEIDRVGSVRHITARRLGYARDHGGHATLDLATHDLDVLSTIVDDLDVHYAMNSGHRDGPELHVCALLVAGTVSISLEASHLHPLKTRELEVVGEAGTMRLDYQRQAVTFTAIDGKTTALEVALAEPLEREWQAFLRGDQGADGKTPLRLAAELRLRDGELASVA